MMVTGLLNVNRNIEWEKSPALIRMIAGSYDSIFLFGVSYLAYETYQYLRDEGYSVRGFVCDFNAGSTFKGVPVFSREEFLATRNCAILLCSLTSHRQVAGDFKEVGFFDLITFYEFSRCFPDLCNKIYYFQGLREDIDNNSDKYDWLARRLEDDFSKNTLKELLTLRYNYAFDLQVPAYKSRSDQYFSSMIELKEGECFLDAGGNKAETTRSFIGRVNKKYEAIYFFEPQADLVACLDRELTAEKNFFICNKLLYSCKTRLSFSDDFGSGSKIADNDAEGVFYQTTTIDDEVKHKPTFIKINVEGAELEVIAGAKKAIVAYKPKLAICVYHQQSHFWKVPELILSYRADYKIFLRHHSEGIFETVIYCV